MLIENRRNYFTSKTQNINTSNSNLTAYAVLKPDRIKRIHRIAEAKQKQSIVLRRHF